MASLVARVAERFSGARPQEESADASKAAQPPHTSPSSTFAALERALEGREAPRRRFPFLLVFRFALINMVGLALLGAAHFHGWVGLVVAGDRTGIVLLIGGLFLFGLAICGWRIVQTARELNLIREFDPLRPSRVAAYLEAVRARSADSRAISADALRLKLSTRIGIVRHIANTLVFFGLIGTVVGFIIALSGVQPNLASDVKAVGPMVSTLIQGMSVALYTTLVGAVLNVWLMANYRLLLSGTVNLITAIVELGERHARD